MDIRKYQVFLRATECGSLTEAGEDLGYTQSGVSHMMKGLEDELGFRLLTRSRSGVTMTPQGEKLLPIIRELVKWSGQLDQTVSQINGIVAGTIRIGALSSIAYSWLPKILHTFQQSYPNIDIDILDGGFDEIEDWTEKSRIDIGFLSIQKSTSRFEVIPLKKDDFVAVLPLSHTMAHESSFPLSSFNGQTFIISSIGADYDIHRIIEENDIKPKIKYSSTDDHTIISMVANGLGICILPELMIEGHKGEVAAIKLKPRFSRELGMIVRSYADVSPAAEKFIAHVKKCFPASR